MWISILELSNSGTVIGLHTELVGQSLNALNALNANNPLENYPSGPSSLPQNLPLYRYYLEVDRSDLPPHEVP